MERASAQLTMPWNLACPDWPERLRTGRSLVPDLPLWGEQATKAVKVFDMLRLADVPGTPRLEDAAGDWFRDIVRALFGSLDPKTGERMVRELFVLVPKKNSKTSYGALLMLVALLLNLRPRARFIMTAPTQDITELAFGQAEGAVRLDPVLQKKLHVRSHVKTIEHRVTGATLEILSFDPAVLTGQKPAGVLIDEVHVVSKMAKSSSALRQLRSGMLPIPEAFLVQITTQSEEPPSGIFLSELETARAIRDGKSAGAMLPVLYELPEAMQLDPLQWRNPANWSMVTPNAGRSITIARLEQGMREAETRGEAEFRAWASQHLNVQIGVGLRSDAWAGAQFWERGIDRTLTLDALLERSEVVTVGVDGGGLDDLLGVAVIGRERETKRWLGWAHAMISPEGLERRKANAAQYETFRADGDLTVVEALPDDLEALKHIVERCLSAGLLAQVGVDPAGIGGAVDALNEIGVNEASKNLVGVSQGIKLMNAAKTIERKLVDGTFRHGGARLMGWCVGNAKTRQTPTAVLIERAASGYGKIDPLMALFNAAHLMGFNPEPGGAGVVEQGFIEV